MDLSTCAQVLTSQGFSIVRQGQNALVATRMRFYWGCCMRMSTVVRVQFVQHQTLVEARRSHHWLKQNAGILDVSAVPRGFSQARTLLDICVCDSADPDVIPWATTTVDKFMGGAYHPVIITQGVAHHDTPIWGAAYWPYTKHLIQQIVAQDTSGTKEPSAIGGILIGVLMLWPSMLLLATFCCGLPLLYLPFAWSTEKKRMAALPGRYASEAAPQLQP